ncbi:MAG: hypothetical protein P4M08_03290 [Oligoflexia bacterium]|nr:hypothetical protein [Oligoflexia bacterium]
MIRSLAGAIASLLWGAPAMARPEYALKTKLNCTACHVTPWGGGPRNLMGKAYGAHGHAPSKISMYSDLYYGDVRFIDYIPTAPTTGASGASLMEAAITGDVPIIQGERGQEMRAVLTYNDATLSGSQVREAYVRFQMPSDHEADATYVLLGRFYVPFGLLTDEHRTYAQIQTDSRLNDYDVGADLSGNFSHDWHYDLAVVNNLNTGGNFTAQDWSLAGVVNFRWNPAHLPVLLGLSGEYERYSFNPTPYAGAFYAGLSLDGISHGSLKGSVFYEFVGAKNWDSPAVNGGGINPGLGSFFVPASQGAYLNSLSSSTSLGQYVWLRYELSQFWNLIYKMDYLALDASNTGDAYWRHGFGFESFLNSNLILDARFEKAFAGAPGIGGNDVLAVQSDFLVMLRLWI